MSKRTTRIYHGGSANTGSGGSGYPSPADRLLDQIGAVLLQGISDIVHLLPGKEITADQDMYINVPIGDLMAFVTADIYASCDTIEIDADDQIYLWALNETVIASSNLVDIRSTGNVEVHVSDNIMVEFAAGVFGRLIIKNLKSGATQALANAIPEEVYHCTVDHTLRIGV